MTRRRGSVSPGRTAFVAENRRIVTHGGISLEELAAPFVHVEIGGS